MSSVDAKSSVETKTSRRSRAKRNAGDTRIPRPVEDGSPNGPSAKASTDSKPSVQAVPPRPSKRSPGGGDEDESKTKAKTHKKNKTTTRKTWKTDLHGYESDDHVAVKDLQSTELDGWTLKCASAEAREMIAALIVKERPGDEGEADPSSATAFYAYKDGETRLICFIATLEGGGAAGVRLFVHDPLGYTKPATEDTNDGWPPQTNIRMY